MFEDLNDQVLKEYECEGCGLKVTLTERDAFEQGWDYPPFMGEWGTVSPRTCGNCGINCTAYWFLVTKAGEPVPQKHLNTIERILKEVPLT
jgi:hypothetical protein